MGTLHFEFASRNPSMTTEYNYILLGPTIISIVKIYIQQPKEMSVDKKL